MWRKICLDVFESAWSRGIMHMSFEVQMISSDKYQTYFGVKWRLCYVFDPSNVSLARGDFWKLGNITQNSYLVPYKKVRLCFLFAFQTENRIGRNKYFAMVLRREGNWIVSLFTGSRTPRKIDWGSVERFPKPLPYLWPKAAFSHDLSKSSIPYSCPDTVAANIY